MKHFLSVYLPFLTLNNDPVVKLGYFGVSASNVDFIPRTIRRTELGQQGPKQNQEDSSNVNLLAVLFGDEFQVFYGHPHYFQFLSWSSQNISLKL